MLSHLLGSFNSPSFDFYFLEAGLTSLKDDSNKYEYKLQEAQELAQSLAPHSKQVN